MASSPDSPLIRWGLVGTFVWIFTVVVYATAPGVNMQWAEPNLVGDYFAGALAPLAVFWVVVGFFQQSKALLQQQEALRSQMDEFKLQRQEFELTNAHLAREEARAHSLALPAFGLRRVSTPVLLQKGGVATDSAGTEDVFCVIELENRGPEALRVDVSIEGIELHLDLLVRGAKRPLPNRTIPEVLPHEVLHVGPIQVVRPTWFRVDYEDRFGRSHFQWFHFQGPCDDVPTVYRERPDVDKPPPEDELDWMYGRSEEPVKVMPADEAMKIIDGC